MKRPVPMESASALFDEKEKRCQVPFFPNYAFTFRTGDADPSGRAGAEMVFNLWVFVKAERKVPSGSQTSQDGSLRQPPSIAAYSAAC